VPPVMVLATRGS